MGQRAAALADAFERINAEVVAVVARCSAVDWDAVCAAEGWSVGVVAHHIAGGHMGISGAVQKIANGESFQLPNFDKMNAEHAIQFASTTKAETLALLRQNAAAAAAIVRGLGDAQLDRVGGSLGMSAAQAIERILIGHVHDHHASIKKTI